MKSFATVLAFTSSVAAHGYISSPTPRLPGKGLKAACGEQVFNQQNSDHYGNIQGSLQNLQGSHPDCRMWHCKGTTFADAGEIHSFTAGQKIPMKVEIRAPHDGVANVSVVKVSSDSVVGKPLISWDQYALTSSPASQHPEWTNFEITMPDVSSECAKAGDCVIQWYWDAPKISQTYEACIDFSMGGGGSGSAPALAPVASTKPTPVGSAAPSASPTKGAQAAQPATSPGASNGSGNAMPKTFTTKTFIAWLQENAGSDAANKIRRMVTGERAHPRAFQI